jgi:cell wall-associated NlpC family hydrolase
MTWAGRYIGLPFIDGGRGPVAVDCWGLVRLVFAQERAIDLPTYGEISAGALRSITRAIQAGQEAPEVWRQVKAPQAFDVAVMRGGASWRPCHVGVMVNGETVLHVEKDSATCLEPINGQVMKHRIIGFWRHAEMIA